MTDELLRRSLQAIDAPMRPNPGFVDELHARLSGELGFTASTTTPGRPQATVRPRVRRRGRVGWLAVAALLALAALALVLTQQGRRPVVPPPSSSPSVTPSTTPSLPPSPPASSSTPTAPAIPESSPTLDNLRSDATVLYESGAMEGLPRLRVLQPDLSSVELLPEVPGVQFGAAWRPDGERLAFVSYDAVEIRTHPLIWETDAEGAEPILLSEGCGLPTCVAEYEPGYSPDGTRLVFVRTNVADGGDVESFVAIRDLETGAVTELEATRRPRAAAENLHPRWSPDGQTIAYGVTEYGEFGFPGTSTLHLVDADGTNERIIGTPDLHAGEPEWSQDGEKILFASNPYRPVLKAVGSELDAPHGLGVMDADGSNAMQFDFGVPIIAGSWTGNHDQILFTLMEGGGTGAQRPSNPRLFVMDPDGSNVLPLTRSPGNALYAVQQPSQ